MKVVFVVGSLSGGGAERVVSELATRLSQMKYEVYIILIASLRITYNIPEDVKILDCTKKYRLPGIGFISRVISIRDAFLSVEPDFVVSFTSEVNIYSIFSSINTKVHLVLAERNDPRFDPRKKSIRIARRLLYPLADSFVFQTNGEKIFFPKNIQDRSAVIFNPVNPSIPEPFLGPRKPVFVSAVRLEPQKNIKMAIDAFKMVHRVYPQFTFEIYGDGSLKEELTDYIDSQGLNKSVFLRGASNVLYDDIKDCFAFLLSSNYEGMSNSLIEAMALGLPSISTNYPSGGACEIINDGVNGFLVPTNDVTLMVEKMILLITDEELYNKISRNAINIRKALDIDKICNQWIDFLSYSKKISEQKVDNK